MSICFCVFETNIIISHRLNIKNKNSIDLGSWKYTTSKVENCVRLCFEKWKSTLLSKFKVNYLILLKNRYISWHTDFHQQMETILVYSWKHFWQKILSYSIYSVLLYVFPWTIIMYFFKSILFRLHFFTVSWICCKVSHRGIRSWWNIYFPRKTCNKYICQILYLMCSKEMVSSSPFIYPEIYSQFTLTVRLCYPLGVLLYLF